MTAPAHNAKPDGKSDAELQNARQLLQMEFATQVVVIPLSAAPQAASEQSGGLTPTDDAGRPPSPADPPQSAYQQPDEQSGLMQILDNGAVYLLTPRPAPGGIVGIRPLKKDGCQQAFVAEITECRPVENLGYFSVATVATLRHE